jgi:hypothetical protein
VVVIGTVVTTEEGTVVWVVEVVAGTQRGTPVTSIVVGPGHEMVSTTTGGSVAAGIVEVVVEVVVEAHTNAAEGHPPKVVEDELVELVAVTPNKHGASGDVHPARGSELSILRISLLPKSAT